MFEAFQKVFYRVFQMIFYKEKRGISGVLHQLFYKVS